MVGRAIAIAIVLAGGCGTDAPSGASKASGGGGASGAPSAAGVGAASGAGGGGAGGTGGQSASGTSGGASGADAPGAGGASGTPSLDASTPDPTQGVDGATQGEPATPSDTWCVPGASYPDPLPEASARTATLVQGGFGFIEGPVWLASKGVLLFSDMDMGNSTPNGPPSRIRRLMPPASFDVFLEGSNSNGLAVDGNDDVLACTHDTQALSRFDADTGARTDLPVLYQGKALNSPNDLAVASDGTVYFTDPDWQLAPRTSQTGFTGVYRRTPTGELLLIDDSLPNPNGIALSPDETTLYVGANESDVFAYTVQSDGAATDRRVFASPGASDGMTVDCAGNVYVSAATVRVFAPDGQALGEISVAQTPANVAFGGADRRTLYITARSGLYAIGLRVPGRPY